MWFTLLIIVGKSKQLTKVTEGTLEMAHDLSAQRQQCEAAAHRASTVGRQRERQMLLIGSLLGLSQCRSPGQQTVQPIFRMHLSTSARPL